MFSNIIRAMEKFNRWFFRVMIALAFIMTGILGVVGSIQKANASEYLPLRFEDATNIKTFELTTHRDSRINNIYMLSDGSISICIQASEADSDTCIKRGTVQDWIHTYYPNADYIGIMIGYKRYVKVVHVYFKRY